jgi:hypothetical protein
MERLTRDRLSQLLRRSSELTSDEIIDFIRSYELTVSEQESLKRLITFNKAQQLFGLENFGMQNMDFRDYIKDREALMKRFES